MEPPGRGVRWKRCSDWLDLQSASSTNALFRAAVAAMHSPAWVFLSVNVLLLVLVGTKAKSCRELALHFDRRMSQVSIFASRQAAEGWETRGAAVAKAGESASRPVLRHPAANESVRLTGDTFGGKGQGAVMRIADPGKMLECFSARAGWAPRFEIRAV